MLFLVLLSVFCTYHITLLISSAMYHLLSIIYSLYYYLSATLPVHFQVKGYKTQHHHSLSIKGYSHVHQPERSLIITLGEFFMPNPLRKSRFSEYCTFF